MGKLSEDLALVILVTLSLGCSSSSTPVKTSAVDYFQSLDREDLYKLAVWCLRDNTGTCSGKSYALRLSNSNGPDFNPDQKLSLLDWKFQQAAKSTAAFQFKIKDDGIIYDTTINVDSIVRFGPKGVKGMEVKRIYGGDWGFSEGFAATALIAGAAVTAYANRDRGSSTRSSTDTAEEPSLHIGNWGRWLDHSPLTGGKHREAWVTCPSGLSFEVEEHIRNGKHWFQRDAGAVLLPKNHSTLRDFLEAECGEGTGFYDRDRRRKQN